MKEIEKVEVRDLTEISTIKKPLAKQTTGALKRADPQEMFASMMFGLYFNNLSYYIKEHMAAGVAGKDAECLGRMIMDSGDGDYIEIGVGAGGSLILVGKIREAFGITGGITGIDPFDARYNREPHWICSKEKCERHLADFGVEAELIQSVSQPWPLPDRTFSCALIDGDHQNRMPQMDYLSLRDIVTGQIMFHHANLMDDVIEAVEWAEQDGWKVRMRLGKSVLMEKGDFNPAYKRPHGYPRWFRDPDPKKRAKADSYDFEKELGITQKALPDGS